MIEACAPGKLFIAGEYAVVTPNEPAVLVAVDRYIRVRVRESVGPTETNPSRYVAAAIDTVEQLRRERGLESRTYKLSTDSELEDADGTKFGLGSSAAVTVATVQALGEFYDLDLTAVERFRLALLATITVSPQASGGDLAASTFGGWLRYCSPDRRALADHRAHHGVTSALTSDAWQGCETLTLPAPSSERLLVGWTGSPASTTTLVTRVHNAGPGNAPSSETQPQFLAASRACVEEITRALESRTQTIAEPIRTARRLLQELGQARGIDIETAKLRALCDIAESHGFAAKPSGAGGGDCGIVLVTPETDIAPIVRAWQQHEIRHLDLAVPARTSDAEGGQSER